MLCNAFRQSTLRTSAPNSRQDLTVRFQVSVEDLPSYTLIGDGRADQQALHEP
jgi:hypothetical protein